MIKRLQNYSPFDFIWSFIANGPKRVNVSEIIEPLALARDSVEPSFIVIDGDPFELPQDEIDLMFAVVKMCGDHLFAGITNHPDRQLAYMRSPNTPGRVANAIHSLLWHPVTREVIGAENADFTAKLIKIGDSSLPFPPGGYCAGAYAVTRDDDSKVIALVKTPAAVRFLLVAETAKPVTWHRHALASDFIPSKQQNGSETIDTTETLEQRIDWIFCDRMNSRSFLDFTFKQAIDVGVPVFLEKFAGDADMKNWPASVRLRQLPAFGARYMSIVDRIIQRTGATSVDPATAHWDFDSVVPVPPEIATTPAIDGAEPIVNPSGEWPAAFVAWSTADDLSLTGGDMGEGLIMTPDELRSMRNERTPEEFERAYLGTFETNKDVEMFIDEHADLTGKADNAGDAGAEPGGNAGDAGAGR